MKWQIHGTKDGKPGTWTIDCNSEQDARRRALAAGAVVTLITQIRTPAPAVANAAKPVAIRAEERCEECDARITRDETPNVWKDKVVCSNCYRKLQPTKPVKSQSRRMVVHITICSVLLLAVVAGSIYAWKSRYGSSPVAHVQTAETIQQIKPSTPQAIVAHVPTPQELLDSITSYSIGLIAKIDQQDRESVAKYSRPDNEIEQTTTFKFIGADVQKTDSLIDPMVGVLRIQKNYMNKSSSHPEYAGGFTQLITAKFSPKSDGTWKCVHTEVKLESEWGSTALHVGETSDETKWMQDLIAKP